MFASARFASSISFVYGSPRTRPIFRNTLWIAVAYLAVLLLVALFPPRTASSVRDTTETPEPTARADCVVCGIGETCDPESGQCMFVEATPLPCVEGTRFDDKAGFCLPEGRPTIAPPTLAPAVREPEQPQGDLPGFFDDD